MYSYFVLSALIVLSLGFTTAFAEETFVDSDNLYFGPSTYKYLPAPAGFISDPLTGEPATYDRSKNYFLYTTNQGANIESNEKQLVKFNDEEFFNFIFADLASKGINNLLIETGSIINTLLLSLNLVDELLIFRSGNIIGNDGLSFVNNLNFREINDLKNYKISSLKFFEDDILEIRNLKK